MSLYTDLLRLTKQSTGENPTTWGTVLNDNVFEMVEDAIAGVVTVATTGGSTTLTVNNGVTDQARAAVLRFTGSLASNATIIVPDAVTKQYVVRNDTTGAFTLTIKTTSGTGVAVPQGVATIVRADGTNVVSDLSAVALAGVTPSAFILTLLDDANAAAALTTLVAQPLDATLTALAGVTVAADKLIYATAADTFATTDLTAFARTVLDDADAVTMRATLGQRHARPVAEGGQGLRCYASGRAPGPQGQHELQRESELPVGAQGRFLLRHGGRQDRWRFRQERGHWRRLRRQRGQRGGH